MEIDLLNKLYPYVGQYESAGLDGKNRIGVPKKLFEQLNNRKEAFGLEDRVIYYSPVTGDEAVLILRDHILNEKECPDFNQSEVDRQNRLTIKESVVKNLTKKRDLIYVGYRDHIRIYSQEDWKNIQATKQ